MSGSRTARAGLRGGPLLSLAIVLGGWVLLRVALWEPPLAGPPLPFGTSPVTTVAAAEPPAAVPGAASAEPESAPVLPRAFEMPAPAWRPPPLEPWVRRQISNDALGAEVRPGHSAAVRRAFAGAGRILSHTMLVAAGYGEGDVPHAMARYKEDGARLALPTVSPAPFYAPQAAEAVREGDRPRRWGMDLWALWREDTTTPLTSGRESYGRSQAGAVLRYRLDPGGGHRPELHLRASRALAGEQESEAALGASARPLPGVPVRLAAEARLSQTDAGAQVRAAAYAVSEFPPLDLPGGMTGEAYLQGGYVTGAFATGFVDGQARVTREIAGGGNLRLSAGGAAWGGAQEGTARLDVGPSAALTFRLGPGSSALRGRLSADYRFRVAGEAEPASGPALTLSAGF